MAFYNYFFHLASYESVEIRPRDRHTFTLEGNPMVGRISQHKTFIDPATLPDPTFDSSRDLLRAIAQGRPQDSWLEADFNEFEERQFLRGKIHPIFKAIWETTSLITNDRNG